MLTNDDTTLFKPSKLTELLDNEVSEHTLAKWRCTGQGPRFIRAGRQILYRRSDIEAWLTSRTITHTRATPTAAIPTRRTRRR